MPVITHSEFEYLFPSPPDEASCTDTTGKSNATFANFYKANRARMRQATPNISDKDLVAQLLKAWKQIETEHSETMY